MIKSRHSHQHTPVHSCRGACRHTHTDTNTDTHSHHTQTPSLTTYMFPLLSSLILELITEKTPHYFLLFKPDVSGSSLPLRCFNPPRRSVLFVVNVVGESISFFKSSIRVCVHVLILNPAFSPISATADLKVTYVTFFSHSFGYIV